jgi:hypothetical protein
MLSGEPAASVRRAETVTLAEAYCTLRWQPTEANVFHGNDAEGIRVDTPDIGFRRPGIRGGWWLPGKENVGVPYMWGGFSSLSDFQAGIRNGAWAGDVCTHLKRAFSDAAVSRQAVGIDCSGLISRCWRLGRSYSTRQLPGLCEPIAPEDLKPGDILNLAGHHVLLFAGWSGPGHQVIVAYESGSPPTWKALRHNIRLAPLLKAGYLPWRYKKIVD